MLTCERLVAALSYSEHSNTSLAFALLIAAAAAVVEDVPAALHKRALRSDNCMFRIRLLLFLDFFCVYYIHSRYMHEIKMGIHNWINELIEIDRFIGR